MTFRRRAVLLATAAAGAAPALCAFAQAAPSRESVRVLCGFPAGGTADVVARLYAEGLRNRYAKASLVENRTGAGARLAIQSLKTAAPDGSTLLLTPTSTLTLYPHVYRKLGYDPAVDVVPVASVARFAFALAVRNDLPIKTVAEAGAWAKANPAKATYGSPAAGSSPHFLGQILADAMACTFTHVPYRGTGPAMQDLIGGNIAFVLSTVGDLTPNHRAGKLRILGVSSEARLPDLADVPTFHEAGIERATLYESFALFAPPGTPAATVAQAASALKAASGDRELVDTLTRLEIQPEHEDPAALAARLKRETLGWAPIVKASGFQIDD